MRNEIVWVKKKECRESNAETTFVCYSKNKQAHSSQSLSLSLHPIFVLGVWLFCFYHWFALGFWHFCFEVSPQDVQKHLLQFQISEKVLKAFVVYPGIYQMLYLPPRSQDKIYSLQAAICGKQAEVWLPLLEYSKFSALLGSVFDIGLLLFFHRLMYRVALTFTISWSAPGV
jgi:hypothetical protein